MKAKTPKKYKKNKKLEKLNSLVEHRLIDMWKVAELPPGGPNQLTLDQATQKKYNRGATHSQISK